MKGSGYFAIGFLVVLCCFRSAFAASYQVSSGGGTSDCLTVTGPSTYMRKTEAGSVGVPKFDSSLGTLTSVSVKVVSYCDMILMETDPDAMRLSCDFECAAGFHQNADPASACIAGPPSCHFYIDDDVTHSEETFYPSGRPLSDYLGSGAVQWAIDGYMDAYVTDPAWEFVGTYGAVFNITVTYTYTPHP